MCCGGGGGGEDGEDGEVQISLDFAGFCWKFAEFSNFSCGGPNEV